MPERDVHALRAEALAALAKATQAANGAPDVESALRYLTAATQEVLGDKEAHLRPGGLRAGEHQFTDSGIFLMTPDRQHQLLVAEHGFPPEQHRLRIPIDLGHPGWVAQHQRPLVLTNTDEASDFRQILKTARMGSALFGPMIWREIHDLSPDAVLMVLADAPYDESDYIRSYEDFRAIIEAPE